MSEPVPLLSLVVPCFNEESVVRDTHRRLQALGAGLEGVEVEIVFVDDGSRDGTRAILRALSEADSTVRVVVLSRNFGQQIAIIAGLAAAKGDAVAVLDCDLQDPPEVIADMLARWRDGADVAFGLRTAREGESRLKQWRSNALLRLVNRLSDVPIPLNVGEFRLMDRRVVDVLLAMPERDPFFRGMVPWAGFRQEAVPFRRHRRASGKSKWPFRRSVRVAVDGLLSFTIAPLRLAVWLGFLVTAAAVVGTLYALAQRLLTDVWVPGWATLLIAILFMGGTQLVLIGMLAEYLGRIYAEVKRRPLYVVQERVGFPSASAEAVDAAPGHHAPTEWGAAGGQPR